MTDSAVHILLVEDNPNDVELTLHALAARGVTAEIHVARDGAEALEYLLGGPHAAPRGSPALVLLDLRLPHVDGLEVLRRMRSHARTRTLPVIVLTSSRDDRDVFECRQLGVAGYIVKPVDLGQFLEAVRTLGLRGLPFERTPAAGGRTGAAA
ncbi:MAG: response regulator [Candidatus Eisenbacteria bacterium]|nr:response regulator [Candidatus Eisenbacteria bacterium]